RSKGLGTEVLRWEMEYAFMEMGLHRVQLKCYSFNLGALACYRKVGFIEEGRMRKTYFKTGEWHDTFVMAILDEEWMELR
ncbi:acyl-CoA N-acyltransferase, partial [Teratosphaeria nubilosa]